MLDYISKAILIRFHQNRYIVYIFIYLMGFVMLEGAQGNFPIQAYACNEYYSLTLDFRALALIKAEPNQNTQTTECERQGRWSVSLLFYVIYGLSNSDWSCVRDGTN